MIEPPAYAPIALRLPKLAHHDQKRYPLQCRLLGVQPHARPIRDGTLPVQKPELGPCTTKMPNYSDGNFASFTIRIRPCPLHRGHRTCLSATRIEASGSRRFTVKSISIIVLHLSQTILSNSASDYGPIRARNWCAPITKIHRAGSRFQVNGRTA